MQWKHHIRDTEWEQALDYAAKEADTFTLVVRKEANNILEGTITNGKLDLHQGTLEEKHILTTALENYLITTEDFVDTQYQPPLASALHRYPVNEDTIRILKENTLHKGFEQPLQGTVFEGGVEDIAFFQDNKKIIATITHEAMIGTAEGITL